MRTKEETYFLEQLGSPLDASEDVFCGYFRTSMEGSTSFVGAAKAKAYFLAVHDDVLYGIQTRAPAFSKPLLENKASFQIPFSKLRTVHIREDIICIETEATNLVLAYKNKNKNKYFPT